MYEIVAFRLRERPLERRRGSFFDHVRPRSVRRGYGPGPERVKTLRNRAGLTISAGAASLVYGWFTLDITKLRHPPTLVTFSHLKPNE